MEKPRSRIQPLERLLLALAAAAGSGGTAQAQPPTKQALVQIRIDTSYDDRDDTLRRLSVLSRQLPPSVVALQRDQTWSDVILQRYGVSKGDSSKVSYLPRLYDTLASEIARLNGLTDLNSVQPDTFLVPSVPKRALTQFNPAIVANRIPKTQFLRRHTTRRDAVVPQVIESDRLASQSTDILLPMDEDRLFELMRSDTVFAKLAKPLNHSVEVELAPGCDQPAFDPNLAWSSLGPQEKTKLRQALTADARRNPLLFIVDSGWPDASDYVHSLTRLAEVFDAVWGSIGALPPPRRRPQPSDFREPSCGHAKLVHGVLDELRALDLQKRVEIVFVPMLNEQGAEEILTELVQLYLVIEHMGARLGESPPGRDDISERKSSAKRIVRDLPRSWDGLTVETDKAVIDALLSVADLYAAKTRTACFVNESWTVHSRQLYVTYPSPFFGVVVAAAGNTSGLDIIATRRDFAQRCIEHLDTVAVLNMDRSGMLLCSSSAFDSIHVADALALGFDGVAIPNSVCGTSFAAPRVAWLLAAAEATRSETPTVWSRWLEDRIMQARSPGAGLRSLRLDPCRLLNLTCN